jgi:hypothetical protein
VLEKRVGILCVNGSCKVPWRWRRAMDAVQNKSDAEDDAGDDGRNGGPV